MHGFEAEIYGVHKYTSLHALHNHSGFLAENSFSVDNLRDWEREQFRVYLHAAYHNGREGRRLALEQRLGGGSGRGES